MSTIIRFSFLLTFLAGWGSRALAQYGESAYYNDFRLSGLTVPAFEIVPAGPPRDGIPSIDKPQFVAAAEADFMTGIDQVIGVVVNGEARAYPVRILGYHEVVNDQIGNQSVAVTFNPLCASGLAYKAQINKQAIKFGTSGLVYNSNTLFYDRQTESLWSQVTGEAISGPASGMKLEMVPSAMVSWTEWKAKYPQTQVLTTNTGHKRNYECLPYDANSNRLLFPVSQVDNRLPLKEKVVGVEVAGHFKAYPFSLLPNGTETATIDEFNGQKIQIDFNKEAQTAFVTDGEGNILPSTTLYWFAWFSFHPQTEVHGFISHDQAMSLGYITTGMP